jgi:prephenate dehydrogenase
MTIGLIGFGRFGQFAARFIAGRATVAVYDVRRSRGGTGVRRVVRRPLSTVASQPVVILAVPIAAMRSTLKAIRPHLRPGALVIDVCSVKTLPIEWMTRLLPRSVRILGTHPLFGPDSVERSLRGRLMVLCPVRIPGDVFLRVQGLLHKKGLDVAVMTPEAHDRMMAETLLLAQFVGRIVNAAGLRRWPKSTTTYAKLMEVADIASRDTEQLFRDMWRFNAASGHVAAAVDRGKRKVEKMAGRS